MSEHQALKKLNVGCGGQKLPGFVNLDKIDYPHVDIQFDLEKCASWNQMRYRDGSAVLDSTFDRMVLSHVIEHIVNLLPMMEELWRVMKPGGKMAVLCPYGSSDNADEDPTHVRRIFKESSIYFSQAVYGQNDYGYRGDWDTTQRIFILNKSFFQDEATDVQISAAIENMRNVVTEFQMELTAVKPCRAPGSAAPAPVDFFRMR